MFPAPTPPRPTEILDDSRFKNDRRSNVRYSSKIKIYLMIYIIITASCMSDPRLQLFRLAVLIELTS